MICAGNWKMNMSPSQASEFLLELKKSIDGLPKKNFIIFPPAFSLPVVSEQLKGSGVGFGAQNISAHESGAFTGENSVVHAKDLKSQYVLVGHSERRSLYGETDSDVNEKIKLALFHKLKPILCVGESLQQREENQTKSVLNSQIKKGLSGVAADSDLIIAYEPVWAIGTGKVASYEQVNEVHNDIRSYLSKEIGAEFAKNTALLYGGSVKPTNSLELSKVENVDGFLIGGASLQVQSFIEIYKNCVSH